MTSMTDTAPADTPDREIVVTRVFDAPRALVFKAWTDPKHLAHWWGPNGFTITTHEMQFKPGGSWRFVMHGPTVAIIKTRTCMSKSPSPSDWFTGTYQRRSSR